MVKGFHQFLSFLCFFLVPCSIAVIPLGLFAPFLAHFRTSEMFKALGFDVENRRFCILAVCLP